MEPFIHTAIPKKAVVINDLTGFGRCSLAVVLPVMAAMRVQACPVATSVFSSHMGFPSYYYKDLTDSLTPCYDEYDKLGLTFDGICCGFLNSPRQFHSIRHFLEQERQKNAPVILIDPVMGDHGRPYRIVTDQLCEEMRQLVSCATILTPNLTEACMLTGMVYPQAPPDDSFLEEIAGRLLDLGVSRIAITGIVCGGHVTNYCVEKAADMVRSFACKVPSNGESRPGTGDLFAAILTADAVNGVPFADSVKKAADFIRTCVDTSARLQIPIREGVAYENHLSMLWTPPDASQTGDKPTPDTITERRT